MTPKPRKPLQRKKPIKRGTTRPKKRSAYGKGDRGKATRLHSQVVRQKGYCERCGDSKGPFDAAHIIRRHYGATRADPENGWCLCRPCHSLVDTFADEFAALVEKTIGWEGYGELKRRAQEGVGQKVDWAAQVETLKAALSA